MTLVLEHDTAPVAANARFALLAKNATLQRGLGEELAAAFDGADVVETSDLSALIRVLGEGAASDLAAVDLAVLELATAGLGGLVGLLYLRSQFPGMPFLTLTESGDPAELRRCVEAGAAGVLPATAGIAHLAEAISAVLDGEVPEQAFPERAFPERAFQEQAFQEQALAGQALGRRDADALPAGADDRSAGALRRLRSLTPQQMRVLTLLCGGLLNKQIAYELAVSEATVKAHVSAILQKLAVGGRAAAVAFVATANGGLVA